MATLLEDAIIREGPFTTTNTAELKDTHFSSQPLIALKPLAENQVGAHSEIR